MLSKGVDSEGCDFLTSFNSKSILLLNNIPISYRNALFSAVQKQHERTKALFLTTAEQVRHGVDLSLMDALDFDVLKPLIQIRARWTTTSDFLVGWIPIKYIRGADIVVGFGYNYMPILIGVAVAKILGKKTVLFCETTMAEARRSWLRDAAKRNIVRRLYDGYIVPGAASREYLESLGAPARQIGIAVNAVPPLPSSNARRLKRGSGNPEATENSLKIGLVGRLAPEKEFQWAIKSLFAVPAFEFHVAGDGPCRAALSELAATGRVVLYGHLDPADLARFYSNIDILVLPSRYEPWGFVANEAIANGCPVVLSDRVGCRKEITPAAGVVFEYGNSKGLLSAVMTVSENLPEYSLGAERVAATLTPGRQASALLIHLEGLFG